jgi:penicillin-binding protein 1A
MLWVLLLLSIRVNLFGLFGDMPSLRTLENPKSELASLVYSADGVLMGKYFLQNRTPVEYEDLSPHVINALLATEDVRFHHHSGIDPRSLGRVAFGILTFNHDLGGGSTLTQQVAKNLFKTRDDQFEGYLGGVPLVSMGIIKVKEWFVSMQLERNYTKEEILTMYLNTVPFGSNAFGIEVAAKTFFNKPQNKLNIQEAALLVGIVNNPVFFHPKDNPKRALHRRNVVLRKMAKYGYLKQPESEKLAAKPIRLDYVVEGQNVGLAPYFRAYIRDFLLNWAQEKDINLYTDGLKIYTTIDSRMQRYAEEAVKTNMKDQQEKFYQQWQGRNPWITNDGKEIKGYIEQAARKTERYKALKESGNNDKTILRKMSKPVKMSVFSWEGKKTITMSPLDSIRYYKRFLHTGLMSMDPLTGQVKAWVGGINHKYFKYDHVRQSKRQPGSTFKAIVYATAIDNGFTPCEKVANTPVTVNLNGYPPYTPHNFDNHYEGQTMTLRQAMGRSVNTIAAFLMQKVGWII